MTVNSGARLGPYEIVSRLGAGGTGEACEARDTRFEREADAHSDICAFWSADGREMIYRDLVVNWPLRLRSANWIRAGPGR
jgi:hypothetical protein